jgi:hypothetical protein
VRQLLVRASVFRSSPILVTLMMEAARSSETSVLTRIRRRNIPEDAILQVCYMCVQMRTRKVKIKNIYRFVFSYSPESLTELRTSATAENEVVVTQQFYSYTSISNFAFRIQLWNFYTKPDLQLKNSEWSLKTYVIRRSKGLYFVKGFMVTPCLKMEVISFYT